LRTAFQSDGSKLGSFHRQAIMKEYNVSLD